MMQKTGLRRTCGGFTLVELLVVIAIIGILIALLLPAVQAAREAARRMQCQNNLKQSGLACHGFVDAYKVLPPAGILSGGNGGYCTWHILVLPYMEQQQLYDQWDIEQLFDLQTQPARETPVDSYICPSRPRNELVIDARARVLPSTGAVYDRGKGAVVDYIGIRGTKYYSSSGLDDGIIMLMDSVAQAEQAVNIANGGKRFNTKYFLSFSAITDGTSSTMMIGESSAWWAWWSAGYRLREAGYGFLSQSWPLCRSTEPGPDGPFDVYFGSDHPGVCQFVFVDGSVHALPVETAGTVLEKMATRDGGEVVSAAEYEF